MCSSDLTAMGARVGFIALGAGSMLATAVLLLLPEASELITSSHDVAALLLAGIIAAMFIEFGISAFHSKNDHVDDALPNVSQVMGEEPNEAAEALSLAIEGAPPRYLNDANEGNKAADMSINSKRELTHSRKNNANDNAVASSQLKLESSENSMSIDENWATTRGAALAWNNILSDAAHNFLDGILIGVVYLTSVRGGFLVAISIVLHEIPQEIADFYILLAAGWTTKQALLMNLAAASTAIIGTILGVLVGEAFEVAISYCLPIVAGQFMYTTLAQCVPLLLRIRSAKMQTMAFISFGVGIGIVAGVSAIPLGWEHSH